MGPIKEQSERSTRVDAMRRNRYTKASPSINDMERRGCRRSDEEQACGTFTKTLPPVDGFPTWCARLAEDVSFTPDTFHSGSRLDKVPEVAVTP
jgi:hypothetical protein